MSAPRRTGPGSLGQNFLIDANIIDVIARLARLQAADVVLEVGGGEGILTRRLVADTRFVHLIEVDRGLAPGLQDALGARGALHLADAVSYDMATLDPPPNKMVANLPYGVAATVVLKSVFETAVEDWVVMVQREVGERFAAGVGSRAYGVPSVLAQLLCDVKVLRPVSRQVFRPVPNVDSVLLGLTRRTRAAPVPAPDHTVCSGPGPGPRPGPRPGPGPRLGPRPGLGARPRPEVGADELRSGQFPIDGRSDLRATRRLVHDAFAHRRKAMARSISLARGGSAEVREAVRVAVVELGFPADVRAERLTPADFLALAARLAL